jgi:hypothetical protein
MLDRAPVDVRLSAWVSLGQKKLNQLHKLSGTDAATVTVHLLAGATLRARPTPASDFHNHWTVSVICVECLSDPDVPLIVIVYWPFSAGTAGMFRAAAAAGCLKDQSDEQQRAQQEAQQSCVLLTPHTNADSNNCQPRNR